MIIINEGMKLEVDDPQMIKRIIGMALSQFSGTKEFLNTKKDDVTRARWTEEDDNLIIDHSNKGKTPRQIAAMLNRTQRAVHSRMWVLRREGKLKKVKIT